MKEEKINVWGISTLFLDIPDGYKLEKEFLNSYKIVKSK